MVQNGMSGAEGEFNDVPFVKKKQVCKALMELWCGAITRNETKNFEETWRLGRHRRAESPGKRARASREGSIINSALNYSVVTVILF